MTFHFQSPFYPFFFALHFCVYTLIHSYCSARLCSAHQTTCTPVATLNNHNGTARATEMSDADDISLMSAFFFFKLLGCTQGSNVTCRATHKTNKNNFKERARAHAVKKKKKKKRKKKKKFFFFFFNTWGARPPQFPFFLYDDMNSS